MFSKREKDTEEKVSGDRKKIERGERREGENEWEKGWMEESRGIEDGGWEGVWEMYVSEGESDKCQRHQSTVSTQI